MTNTLYEIYTDDSGAFTVGSIFMENDDDIVIRGIDEEGKASAYYALPKKTVKDIFRRSINTCSTPRSTRSAAGSRCRS